MTLPSLHDIPISFAAIGSGSLFVLSSTILPSPEAIIGYAGAIGLGLGVAYASFVQRASKARVQAYLEEDAARKSSTLGKLAEANETIANMQSRLDWHAFEIRRLNEQQKAEREECARDRDELRRQLDDQKAMYDHLSKVVMAIYDKQSPAE
jgi:hypothetical protein